MKKAVKKKKNRIRIKGVNLKELAKDFQAMQKEEQGIHTGRFKKTVYAHPAMPTKAKSSVRAVAKRTLSRATWNDALEAICDVDKALAGQPSSYTKIPKNRLRPYNEKLLKKSIAVWGKEVNGIDTGLFKKTRSKSNLDSFTKKEIKEMAKDLVALEKEAKGIKPGRYKWKKYKGAPKKRGRN